MFSPETASHRFRFHEIFLRDLGGYIMEFVDLEELARERVYEFLFVCAPLPINRGLGSPINPLAMT